ncbi:MAG TPA: DinB family protein [Gemmatimonadaceae bacterium]|nr:DinB family protein [Gemmatimonadaceae bacterium]
MTTGFQPAWLRGPVEGIPALLQPVAHALIDADEDVRKFLPPLSPEEIAARPVGAASIAYHVRHALGSLDRLFTYARGEALTDAQMSALAAEKKLDGVTLTGAQLADEFTAGVQRAHGQLRATRESDLLEIRSVGRARLPATTLGLLVHAAEHTARHVGQLVTTAKIVRGEPT